MVNQCFNNVLVYNLDILSFVVLLFLLYFEIYRTSCLEKQSLLCLTAPLHPKLHSPNQKYPKPSWCLTLSTFQHHIHFHSIWLVKLRHLYLMPCPCFSKNISPSLPEICSCCPAMQIICFWYGLNARGPHNHSVWLWEIHEFHLKYMLSNNCIASTS